MSQDARVPRVVEWVVPAPSPEEHVALLRKYGLTQRVEAKSNDRSPRNQDTPSSTITHSPRKQQASADAEGISYAYTSLPPSKQPDTLGPSHPGARVDWRCGSPASGQASTLSSHAQPSSYKAVHNPPFAPTTDASPELTPLCGTADNGHTSRASSSFGSRTADRRDGNWRHSSHSDSSARGSDNPHRHSTVGEMRSHEKAPFTPVKVLTAHASKDASKCPVEVHPTR